MILLFAQQVQPSGFTFHVDLGQVIIATLVGILGYFVRKMIKDFGDRIDKHEGILFSIVQDLQFLIGVSGMERRKIERNNK